MAHKPCFISTEKKKADLCIYQSSLNPPNYKVLALHKMSMSVHFFLQVLIKDGCIEVHKVINNGEEKGGEGS